MARKLLAEQYEEEYRRVTGKKIKVLQYSDCYEIDWKLTKGKGEHIQILNREQLRYFINKLKEKPTKAEK